MKKKINKIGIIIPTFNRRDYLKAALNCIKKQTIINIELETVVVVDGSTDGTLEMLENDFPHVQIVKGPGDWWFTRCLNEGLDFIKKPKTPTDYILTLNDDTLLPDNYLQTMLDEIEHLPKKSVLGAVSVSSEDDNIITFQGVKKLNKFIFKYYDYKKEEILKNSTYYSAVLPTRGLLFPYILVKDIGGFDNTFPQYGSDYDFVLRAARSGYGTYITNKTYIIEFQELTSSGNPRLNRSFGNYFKQTFRNKYSSNYFGKNLLFVWRYGYKILMPLYFILHIILVFYVFYKYNLKK